MTDSDVVRDALRQTPTDDEWQQTKDAYAALDRLTARLAQAEQERDEARENSKFREEQALDRYRDRNKARNALNAATDRVAELEGALAEAQRLTKDWNHPNADAIADLGHPTKDEPRTTKTGRVLTDADFEQLADEAEQGYDVDHVVERPPKDELRREDVEAMADTITAQQPAQPLIVHPASHPTKDEPPEDESAYTEDTGYLGDGDGSDMPSKDEPTDRGGS